MDSANHKDSKPNDKEQLKDYCCPICLGGEPETMVSGPCRHDFCIPCIERILTTSAATRSSDSIHWSPFDISENVPIKVPNLGLCPICRSEMSLFDLKKKNGPDSDVYVHSKDTDIAHSKLQGMTFIEYRCIVGRKSLHFPSSDEDPTALPYLNMEKVPLKLDDGSQLPSKNYFEPGCHFHERTRTFHGTIAWKKGGDCRKSYRSSARWDYDLAFSSDFRFIARGVLIVRKEACQNMECLHYDCKFPLDGVWKVTWPEYGTSETIRVHGNKFRFKALQENRALHELHFNDPKHPVIHLNDQEIPYTAISGVDLKNQHQGPSVGKSIEWANPASAKPDMIWTRQSFDRDVDILEIIHFGPDHAEKSYYHLLIPGIDNQGLLPTYHPNTIWGNTFCQGLTIGLASYHFMEDDESGRSAYISYEHERTAQWPPLDNGMPVPSKIRFTETSFDSETRTFRGKIDWEGTHNTTWQGSRYWRYEMKFAEEFTCITGGSVCTVPRESEQEIEWSKFGEDLLYVNAGMLEKYRAEAGTDDEEYRRRIVHLTRGESIRSTDMIHYLLYAAQGNSISYPSSFEQE